MSICVKDGELETKVVVCSIFEFLDTFLSSHTKILCECCDKPLITGEEVFFTFSDWHFCPECFAAMTKNKILLRSSENYQPFKENGVFSLRNSKTGGFFDDTRAYNKIIFCGVCGTSIILNNNNTDFPLCSKHLLDLLNMREVDDQKDFEEQLRLLRKMRKDGENGNKTQKSTSGYYN